MATPSDYKLLLIHSVRNYAGTNSSIVISESSSVAIFKTGEEADMAIAAIDRTNKEYQKKETDYQSRGFNRIEVIQAVKLY